MTPIPQLGWRAGAGFIAILAAASLAALTSATPAWAQEAPDALVKRVSEDVLATIKGDPLIQAGNQARIREVIE
jgi:phospholipid transport system substrate-binding protein